MALSFVQNRAMVVLPRALRLGVLPRGARRAPLAFTGSRQLFTTPTQRLSDTDEDAKSARPPPQAPASRWAASVPGLGVAAATATAGFVAADYLGVLLLQAQGAVQAGAGAPSPVSGIPVSIILGLLVANGPVKLPEALRPGLKVATTTVLRAGIVCVGFKLSALDVLTLGAVGVPAVAASISAGLAWCLWAGKRLGVDARTRTLIAAGTSICGVTAITALAPAIRATPREVSTAVANVVLFGTAAMLFWPHVAHTAHLTGILPTSAQVGTFLGLAVHDTSQVVGAALTYSQVYGDEAVVAAATVTKLTRNLALAGVIPGLAWRAARSSEREQSDERTESGEGEGEGGAGSSGTAEKKTRVLDFVPLFVIAFVGASALRTAGDAALARSGKAWFLLEESQFRQLTGWLGGTLGSKYLLGTALAGVGLSTSAAALKGVGIRPFLLGASGAAVVTATGFTMAVLLGRLTAANDESGDN